MATDRSSRTATGGGGGGTIERDNVFIIRHEVVADTLGRPQGNVQGQDRVATFDFGAFTAKVGTKRGLPDEHIGLLGGGDPMIGSPGGRTAYAELEDRHMRKMFREMGIDPRLPFQVGPPKLPATRAGVYSPYTGRIQYGTEGHPQARLMAAVSAMEGTTSPESRKIQAFLAAMSTRPAGSLEAMRAAGASLSRPDSGLQVFLGGRLNDLGAALPRGDPRIRNKNPTYEEWMRMRVPPSGAALWAEDATHWGGHAKAGMINAVPPIDRPGRDRGPIREVRAVGPDERRARLEAERTERWRMSQQELPGAEEGFREMRKGWRPGGEAPKERARRKREGEKRHRRRTRDYEKFKRDTGYDDLKFGEWMDITGGRRLTRKQADDLKSSLEKARERVLLQRPFNKWGPEGLWERSLWVLRAPEAFIMRMARFGGPIGLGLLSVFDRDPAAMPAMVKAIVRELAIKGRPLNQDWQRLSGTTYDMMSLERQHHRELGDEPLFLAEANGFQPRDSYYSSLEEVDRLRVQRGAQDYDTVGLSERVVTWGY